MCRHLVLIVVLISLARSSYAQWPLIDDGLYLNPSDPGRPYSRACLSGSVFNMVEGELWQYAFSGSVAFARHRHGLNFEIPFVRSVFPGIENLSGIGDINAGYSWVFYERKSIATSLTNATFSIKTSFPTGNEYEGHGVGRMIFVPALTFSIRPAEQVGIYPSVRYITSSKAGKGDWAGGFPGAIPDEPSTNPDTRFNVLQLDGVFDIEFNSAWIGLTPIYSYEFNQGESTINLRPEIGKLFSDTFLIKLNSTVYIAGKRRLLYWTQFEVAYYFH
jgi:hypothetical protein